MKVLVEGKYSPGVGPTWKSGSARFLAFYKALVKDSSTDDAILCTVKGRALTLSHAAETPSIYRWELPVNYPVFTVVMLIYH